MGGYDSSKFSKQFSERTGENIKFIKDRVNQDKIIDNAKNSFKGEYDQTIVLINELVHYVRVEADNIINVKKKGKDELKSKMHSIASKLQISKKNFEKKLSTIEAINVVNNKDIYEVTQLINSLMGIAVLPYEVHKSYFLVEAIVNESTTPISEVEAREQLIKNQNELKNNNIAYDYLYDLIIELYGQCKWRSTFRYDFKDFKKENIDLDKIVFNFLRHVRNVVCHSGDSCMSILPLNEGTQIDEVLFYDSYEGQEFAMRLTIKELELLIEKIAAFYQYSKLGTIDKTTAIQTVEENVKRLLKY